MFNLKTLAGVLSILAASLVLPALAVGATAQQPVQLQAMKPDGWGASNSTAQSNVRARYDGVTSVSCVGVYMAGYRSQSSTRKGTSLVWDKNQCSGRVRSGSRFSLVHDARSGGRWITYRLKGASLNELRQESAPMPTPTPPTPPPSNCDPNYSGACVPNVPYDLDCADINGPVYVVGRDPHGFDGDGDGVGCES